MFDLHPDTTSNAASITKRVGPMGKGPSAAVTRSPIQFHFDFTSPFGYFASLRIDELQLLRALPRHWRR